MNTPTLLPTAGDWSPRIEMAFRRLTATALLDTSTPSPVVGSKGGECVPLEPHGHCRGFASEWTWVCTHLEHGDRSFRRDSSGAGIHSLHRYLEFYVLDHRLYQRPHQPRGPPRPSPLLPTLSLAQTLASFVPLIRCPRLVQTLRCSSRTASLRIAPRLHLLQCPLLRMIAGRSTFARAH